MPDTLRLEALRRAVKLIGRDEMARNLGIDETLLTIWMAGHATIPERKFLLVIDVLHKHDESWLKDPSG